MKKQLKIQKLIISLKKFLKSLKSQTVIEYTLLLVIIATLSLSIILPRINNIFTDAVDRITQRINGGN